MSGKNDGVETIPKGQENMYPSIFFFFFFFVAFTSTKSLNGDDAKNQAAMNRANTIFDTNITYWLSSFLIPKFNLMKYRPFKNIEKSSKL